mgnify:CR=1 FL=1
MSRTTNSPAAMVVNGSMASNAKTVCLMCKLVRQSGLTQDSRDIVVKRKTHQEEQREYANLLPENLRSFCKWAALHEFRNLVNDLPAVQHGHRQQIEEITEQHRAEMSDLQTNYLDQIRNCRAEIQKLKSALRNEQERSRRLQGLLRGEV